MMFGYTNVTLRPKADPAYESGVSGYRIAENEDYFLHLDFSANPLLRHEYL